MDVSHCSHAHSSLCVGAPRVGNTSPRIYSHSESVDLQGEKQNRVLTFTLVFAGEGKVAPRHEVRVEKCALTSS